MQEDAWRAELFVLEVGVELDRSAMALPRGTSMATVRNAGKTGGIRRVQNRIFFEMTKLTVDKNKHLLTEIAETCLLVEY